jgi:hypothetical protein
VADSYDALQISTHQVETITYKCGLKISKTKRKTMAFKGRDLVRRKIVINNDIVEQTNKHFQLPSRLLYPIPE